MTQLSQLLSSIVPTFGVFGAGWLCRRVGIWDKSAVHVLNGYAYYIALPALIFQSLLSSRLGSEFGIDDAKLIGGVVAAHLGIAIVATVALSHRAIPRETRAVSPMLLVFGSTAYLGIPYATNTFGPEGTTYASLLSVALVISMLFFSMVVLNRFAQQPENGIKKFLELPFLWTVLAGVAWSVFGLPDLPPFITKTIDTLAGSAGPTALLALGAFHYGSEFHRSEIRAALLLGIGKVMLPSVATYFVLSALGLSGLRLAVGVAMGAVSIAVTAFVLAEQYRVGKKLVVSSLTVSSFVSFLALSALSWLWYNNLI